MCRSSTIHQHGISVLEVLIGLSLLAVLLSFATPSLSGATAKAELKAAVENMEFSIRSARNTARQLNTDVIMHVQQGRHEKHHSVTFSMPALAPTAETAANMSSLLQTFTFSENIRLAASEESIRFDFRGMVDAPVQILLVSSMDDAVNQRLLIE